jgi:hypothetical protein
MYYAQCRWWNDNPPPDVSLDLLVRTKYKLPPRKKTRKNGGRNAAPRPFDKSWYTKHIPGIDAPFEGKILPLSVTGVG